MSASRDVAFYFGLGSRYSYLAATQVAGLERDTRCRVTWRPRLSQTLMQRRGRNPFAHLDARGNWSGFRRADVSLR